MTCELCGAPERSLWTYGKLPNLVDLKHGNWISLQKCISCNALWCSVPHEPYGSFTFVTRWPCTEGDWHELHGLDDGLSLHNWHDALLREQWTNLPADEVAHVEWWRERSYGYNPIDRDPSMNRSPRITRSDELMSLLDSLPKCDSA